MRVLGITILKNTESVSYLRRFDLQKQQINPSISLARAVRTQPLGVKENALHIYKQTFELLSAQCSPCSMEIFQYIPALPPPQPSQRQQYPHTRILNILSIQVSNINHKEESEPLTAFRALFFQYISPQKLPYPTIYFPTIVSVARQIYMCPCLPDLRKYHSCNLDPKI